MEFFYYKIIYTVQRVLSVFFPHNCHSRKATYINEKAFRNSNNQTAWQKNCKM